MVTTFDAEDPSAVLDADVKAKQTQDRIHLLKQLRLGLSSTYYSMAQALGLRRLQDYFQGTTSLLGASDPVWVLGVCYEGCPSPQGDAAPTLKQEVLNAILSDLMSRIWMTYRKGFPQIGESGITSDVGWGCTLRSGQMLLAQVLLHHLVGRQWRRKLEAPFPEEVAQILHWFGDQNSEPPRPFSVHALCSAGQRHGVTVGNWLGPSALCHTLRSVVNHVQPAGLQCRVVASSGGGAPVMCTPRVAAAFADSHHSAAGASAAAEPAAAAAAASPGVPGAGTEQPGGAKGLLLLVPLMLGLHGKVNSRYLPQLQQVLQWPQSAGIVGGRPSSSLYFIGHQGQNVLFLDPHEVQEVATEACDLESYFCSQLRLMPLGNIDPSLAIGFYCRSLEDFQDLCGKLRRLEEEAGGAPLVCLIDREEAEPSWPTRNSDVLSDEGMSESGSPCGPGQREEWEVL